MNVFITDITKEGVFSVLTQTNAGNHREALTPGKFGRAREILPDELYARAEALWTQEVVAAWEQKRREAEARFPHPLPAEPQPDRNAFIDGLMEVMGDE